MCSLASGCLIFHMESKTNRCLNCLYNVFEEMHPVCFRLSVQRLRGVHLGVNSKIKCSKAWCPWRGGTMETHGGDRGYKAWLGWCQKPEEGARSDAVLLVLPSVSKSWSELFSWSSAVGKVPIEPGRRLENWSKLVKISSS